MSEQKTFVRTVVAAVLCCSLYGCSTGSDSRYGGKDDTHKIPILEAPVQSVNGPKRTIAVGKFDTIGSLSAPACRQC